MMMHFGLPGSRIAISDPVSWITIDNLPEISANYGVEVADNVLRTLSARAWLLSSDRSTDIALIESGYRPDLVFSSRDLVSIDSALMVLGLAVDCAGVGILPALSVRIADVDVPAPYLLARPRRQSASAAYVADMRTAVRIYDALAGRRFSFAFQPFAKASAGGRILFQKGLLRIETPELRDDSLAAQPDFVASLERLGLMRRFDCFVMRETIDLLRRDRDAILGCNVSALSAVDDAWWASIFDVLEREPALAARLVVELTNPVMPANVKRAVAFVHALDQLGCHVAIDGFGVEFNPVSFAAVTRPDGARSASVR